MKRFVASLLLASSVLSPLMPAIAVAQTDDDLSYRFYDGEVPLRVRRDAVAVNFRTTPGGTRSLGPDPYVRLQRSLSGEGGTRGGSAAPGTAEVTPLGESFAIVSGLAATEGDDPLRQWLRQQSYVEDTLPVLEVADAEEQTTLVLPNEILLTVESNLSESQLQILLNRNNLEIIRPLEFSNNRYLVRSTAVSGLEVLNVANTLNGVVGVSSSVPNFVQSVPYRVQGASGTGSAEIPNALNRLQETIASLPQPDDSPYEAGLLPLAWHLDTRPQRGNFQNRTDVRAIEAWQDSNGGDSVVVAVIDSLIQWDHPDLIGNLHTVNHPDAFPGETHGWDFTSGYNCNDGRCVVGDPDTRLEESELARLRTLFQDSFRLSDEEILTQYGFIPATGSTDSERARSIRDAMRGTIAAEFHGTWSAGVISARPAEELGTIGVAPNAEILPVRVFGLGGAISASNLIEAIGYAASRDVDVINMSLGGLRVDRALAESIFAVLDEYPDLVIVASAGNSDLDGVSFPAALPGVISVGATDMDGRRTFYSSYGGRLDLVAPGGDTTFSNRGGIVTTGGTWVDGFWRGISVPDYSWGLALDPRGQYVSVQGTSFSAPVVSGVVALMKGENQDLDREETMEILAETATYEGLELSDSDRNRYRLQESLGFTQQEDRLSGVFPLPEPVSPEQYFFGRGLVDAAAAVREAK